jgi:hypothetical protein
MPLVQTGNAFASNVSIVSGTFTSPVNAGDLIVAFAFIYQPGGVSIVSVTDTEGNNYQPIAGPIAAGVTQIWILAAYSAKGGPAGNVLTIQFSGPAVTPAVGWAEFSGNGTFSLDSSGNNTGTGTAMNASCTTIAANDILIGFFSNNAGATITNGSPNLFSFQGGQTYYSAQSVTAVGSGVQTQSATNSAANMWGAIIAAFQLTPPPVPPPVPPSSGPPTNEGQPLSQQLRTCLDILCSMRPYVSLKDWNGTVLNATQLRRNLTSWNSDALKSGTARNPPVTMYGNLIDAYVQYFPRAQQIWLVQGGRLTQLLYTVS